MPNMKRSEINEARNRLQAILIRMDPDKNAEDYITKHEIEQVLKILPALNVEKRGKYIR